MAEYFKVGPDVITLAEELIEAHHPKLVSANIGIIFRDEAPTSGGKSVYGKASKVSAQWRPLLSQEYDFIIWLAHDIWKGVLTKHQRRALLDHELCHCTSEDGSFKLVGHDVEEFNVIVRRYGLWRPSLKEMDHAIQGRLDFDELESRNGRVTAIEAQPGLDLD